MRIDIEISSNGMHRRVGLIVKEPTKEDMLFIKDVINLCEKYNKIAMENA